MSKRLVIEFDAQPDHLYVHAVSYAHSGKVVLTEGEILFPIGWTALEVQDELSARIYEWLVKQEHPTREVVSDDAIRTLD